MKKILYSWVLTGSVFLLCAACASVPRVSSPDQSLLVLISDLEYPSPKSLRVHSAEGVKKISFEREGIALLAVTPGNVSVVGADTGGTKAGDTKAGDGDSIQIPPGAVYLYPRVAGPDGYIRAVTPADQRRAMEVLTGYVGFESWFGRDYINFGPYRPKQYLSGEYFPLEILSDPAGSTISIDNVVWGETPQTIELNAGKYLVEISAEGCRSFRRIISLDAPLELSPALERLDDQSGIQNQTDTRGILVAPVRSVNPGADPYGEVIASTLMINFDLDPGLETVSSDASGASALYPDFSPAEKAGADLLLTGRYNLEEESLFIETILYEATSRRVKFAETYISGTGLEIFGSVDDISAECTEAVSRSLQAAGEAFVEKEAEVNDQLVIYEKSIFKERMLKNRLNRRNMISLKVGMGGLDDSYEYSPDERVGLSQEGPNQLRVDYQRILTDTLSLSASGLMIWGGVSQHDTMSPITDSPDLLLSAALLAGPELAFRTETSDVYFTPSLLIGFMPPYSITAVIEYDIPVRYYAGLEIDVGYRYFFYYSRDSRPWFINLGMFFDMAEFAITPGEVPDLVGIRGALYIGGGTAF